MKTQWIKTSSGYAGRHGFILRTLAKVGDKFVLLDYQHLDEPIYSNSMGELKKLSDDSGSPE